MYRTRSSYRRSCSSPTAGLCSSLLLKTSATLRARSRIRTRLLRRWVICSVVKPQYACGSATKESPSAALSSSSRSGRNGLQLLNSLTARTKARSSAGMNPIADSHRLQAHRHRRKTAFNVHQVDIQCTPRNLQQASAIQKERPQN